MSHTFTRWRLRGWCKDDTPAKPTHDTTVVGDAALNSALKRLEDDPDVVKTTVGPA